MLASVTCVEEAVMVMQAGVDLIDMKNPVQGALGALPLSRIAEIVTAIAAATPTSATIGDLPMSPQVIVDAVMQTAETGVDYVKIGFFGQNQHLACITALKPLTAKGVRIIAVLFADQSPALHLLPELAAAGFYGVMLDTANKNGKNLLDYMSITQLADFVTQAKPLNLESGLAGSLRLEHIASLQALHAGYLGFRGALTLDSDRVAGIEQHRVQMIKNMLYNCNNELEMQMAKSQLQTLDCNAAGLCV